MVDGMSPSSSSSPPPPSSCEDFRPFESPWTVPALVCVGVLLAAILAAIFHRRQVDDFADVADKRRYMLPGWPSSASCCRGAPGLLFVWRLLCSALASTVIVYQYLDVHYPFIPSDASPSPSAMQPSSRNHTVSTTLDSALKPHSDVPGMYRFYTIWNFHLVWFYFASGFVFSLQGLCGAQARAKRAVQESSSSANKDDSQSDSGAYAMWLGVEEDRYSRDFEMDGDSSPQSGSQPNCCHRLHHVVMEIELATTPLISLVVWTVLFEGVERTDGQGEADHKFLSFDSIAQHACNVVMIWVDFYLNGLFVVPMHFLYMYLWTLVYTLTHSIIWLETCFLAYPFMDLTKSGVFVWFFGICSFHGIFYLISICASRAKRTRMIQAIVAENSGTSHWLRSDQFRSTPLSSGISMHADGNASWPVPFLQTAASDDRNGLVNSYLSDSNGSAGSSLNSSHSVGSTLTTFAPTQKRMNSSHYLMGL